MQLFVTFSFLHATFYCNFFQVLCKVYGYDLKNRNKSCKLYVDPQCELNSDLKAIVKMTWPSISPEHLPIVKLPSNFMPMKQSFSMLHKQLAKIFPGIKFENIYTQMKINHLSKLLFFKMLVHKCNLLQQLC